MIQLRFKKPSRSIAGFQTAELPNFTVITGPNGSGKTHLLDAIRQDAIVVTRHEDGNVADIRPADAHGWNPSVLSQNNEEIVQTLNLGYDRENMIAAMHAGFEAAGRVGNGNPNGRKVDEAREQAYRNTCPDEQLLARFQRHARELNKPLYELTWVELDRALPLHWGTSELFRQNLTRVFAAYQERWDRNFYLRYENAELKESHDVLSAEKFRETYGPAPWDLMNEVLKDSGLEFRIKPPIRGRYQSYQAMLHSTVSGAKVPFQDLSSGERLLICIALCLYNVQDKQRLLHRPRLLLLDEIDAYLHPTMAKYAVEAINRSIVQGQRIPVILTTHSPATVSFAPPDSLYLLERNAEGHCLLPVSQDRAVNSLTSGYLALTRNSRIIFVEDKADKDFYNAVFAASQKHHLPNGAHLVFMEASYHEADQTGGKNAAMGWADKLSGAGLTNVYSLIDRDGQLGDKDTGNKRFISRSALENYWIDPLLVYALLVDKNLHAAIYKHEFSEGQYREMERLSDDELQKIANAVCAVVEKHSPDLTSKETFLIQYQCKRSVVLPVWVRDYPGKKLKGKFVDAIRKETNAKAHLGDDELVALLTRKFTSLIPMDLVEVFKDLQRS